MDALDRALARSNGIINTAHSSALQVLKQAGSIGNVITTEGPMGGMGNFREKGANRQRYGLNRGWLYSAINALAQEAAKQPAHVGRITGVGTMEGEEAGRVYRTKQQQFLKRKMPSSMKSLLEHGELVHEPDNPFLQSIERPNPFQHRWQFVYSFVANLNLTGWAFVVGGVGESGEFEMYSLPTTWVTPDHKEGPFSRFKVRDPKDVASGSGEDDDYFTRDQVAFAYLPNPADPLGALAPATSQMMSIRVDDHIQTSQERFFENGIFPGVLVTVGKDPHPEVPGGIRPRLTASQRRQVISAVRKVTGGVANYGNPAIVDGLIERIDRLSATQNEMGWDKSEDKVRDRILSAFGVPPFILGKNLPGSYAQAYIVKELFCGRVNTFLDMLSQVVSVFSEQYSDGQDKLITWWEECIPEDPELRRRQYETGVKEGHITRNEFRAELGLPPIEEDKADRNKLLESVGGMTGTISILEKVGAGTISRETATEFISLFLEIAQERAAQLVGTEENPQNLQEIVSTLNAAVEALKQPVKVDVKNLEERVQPARELIVQDTKERNSSTLEMRILELEQRLTDQKHDQDKLLTGLIHQLQLELTHAFSSFKSQEPGTVIQPAPDIKIELDSMAVGQLREEVSYLKDKLTETIESFKSTLTMFKDQFNETTLIIKESVERPILVEVAAPQVEVKAPEIPEIVVNVSPTPVTVEAPIVNVESPTVNVQPPEVKIEPAVVNVNPSIQPAEVRVELAEKDKPKRAIIHHADGTQSEIQMKD